MTESKERLPGANETAKWARERDVVETLPPDVPLFGFWEKLNPFNLPKNVAKASSYPAYIGRQGPLGRRDKRYETTVLRRTFFRGAMLAAIAALSIGAWEKFIDDDQSATDRRATEFSAAPTTTIEPEAQRESPIIAIPRQATSPTVEQGEVTEQPPATEIAAPAETTLDSSIAPPVQNAPFDPTVLAGDVLNPGDRGERVGALHIILESINCGPTDPAEAAENFFGPNTVTDVQQFQNNSPELETDLLVGPRSQRSAIDDFNAGNTTCGS